MNIFRLKTAWFCAFILAFSIPKQADGDQLTSTYVNPSTNEGRVEKLVFSKNNTKVLGWLAGFPGASKPDDPNYPTEFLLGETDVDWYYEWNIRGKNLIGIASFPKARYKPFIVLRQGGSADGKTLRYFTYTCCMDYGTNKTYTEGRLDFDQEELMKETKLQKSEKAHPIVSPYFGGYGSGPKYGGENSVGDFGPKYKRSHPQDTTK